MATDLLTATVTGTSKGTRLVPAHAQSTVELRGVPRRDIKQRLSAGELLIEDERLGLEGNANPTTLETMRDLRTGSLKSNQEFLRTGSPPEWESPLPRRTQGDRGRGKALWPRAGIPVCDPLPLRQASP
jgi:hypothetical protein